MGRLQTARLENFVRRWGSIKGPGSVLSETLGDVFPILDLENLTPENDLPAGWSRVAGTGTVTGGVAQTGAVQLINPTDSRSLLVITKIIIQAGAQTFGLAIADPFTPTLIATRHLDSRSTQDFNGSAVIAVDTNAAGVLGQFLIDTEAQIDREVENLNGIAILSPGNAFQVLAGATNALIAVTFFARVRLAEPSELSF